MTVHQQKLSRCAQMHKVDFIAPSADGKGIAVYLWWTKNGKAGLDREYVTTYHRLLKVLGY